jgi:hypothetical protein
LSQNVACVLSGFSGGHCLPHHSRAIRWAGLGWARRDSVRAQQCYRQPSHADSCAIALTHSLYSAHNSSCYRFASSVSQRVRTSARVLNSPCAYCTTAAAEAVACTAHGTNTTSRASRKPSTPSATTRGTCSIPHAVARHGIARHWRDATGSTGTPTGE